MFNLPTAVPACRQSILHAPGQTAPGASFASLSGTAQLLVSVVAAFDCSDLRPWVFQGGTGGPGPGLWGTRRSFFLNVSWPAVWECSIPRFTALNCTNYNRNIINYTCNHLDLPTLQHACLLAGFIDEQADMLH